MEVQTPPDLTQQAPALPPTEAPKPRVRPVVDFLKLTKDLRDGVIALAGVVYVLGYVEWAWYARTNHLGILPITLTQCFATGFIPAIVITGLILWEWFLIHTSPHDIEKLLPPGRLKTIVYASVWVLALGGVVSALLILGYMPPGVYHVVDRWTSTHSIEIVLLTLIPTLFWIAWKHIPGFWGHYTPVVVAFILYVPIVLAVTILNDYSRWYPTWPEEFGGAGVRHARLDATASGLSDSTLALLFTEARSAPAKRGPSSAPPDRHSTPPAVLQSDELVVFYVGNASMLVRPITKSRPSDPVFEIRTDVVKAIDWLD